MKIGGASRFRAEIIPIEPDPGNAGAGNFLELIYRQTGLHQNINDNEDFIDQENLSFLL